MSTYLRSGVTIKDYFIISKLLEYPSLEILPETATLQMVVSRRNRLDTAINVPTLLKDYSPLYSKDNMGFCLPRVYWKKILDGDIKL